SGPGGGVMCASDSCRGPRRFAEAHSCALPRALPASRRFDVPVRGWFEVYGWWADLVGSLRHPQIAIGGPGTDEVMTHVLTWPSPLRARIDKDGWASSDLGRCLQCGDECRGRQIGNLCQQVRARFLRPAVADGFD